MTHNEENTGYKAELLYETKWNKEIKIAPKGRKAKC